MSRRSTQTTGNMVFDKTARMLAVSWVLFKGFTKKKAARRLACYRSTV